MIRNWISSWAGIEVIVLVFIVQASVANGQEADEEMIASLNQANLQSSFKLLRERYIEKDKLTLDFINQIALEGLLSRLGNGAELVSEKPEPRKDEDQLRLVSGLITQEIAYLRPASMSGNELKHFDTVLNGFERSPASVLILDLRCPGGVTGMRNAAEYCSRFVEPGTDLFRIERPDDSGIPQAYKARKGRKWTKRIVVLVDRDTCPAGEVLAAILQEQLGCLVVGESTAGRTAEYEEVPMGKGGLLRYAVAEVVVKADKKLFGVGVIPDLKKKLDPQAKFTLFLRAQRDGVLATVEEMERARLNEAALVAGTNPELVTQTDLAADPSESDLRDNVIQGAVDVVTAVIRMEPR